MCSICKSIRSWFLFCHTWRITLKFWRNPCNLYLRYRSPHDAVRQVRVQQLLGGVDALFAFAWFLDDSSVAKFQERVCERHDIGPLLRDRQWSRCQIRFLWKKCLASFTVLKGTESETIPQPGPWPTSPPRRKRRAFEKDGQQLGTLFNRICHGHGKEKKEQGDQWNVQCSCLELTPRASSPIIPVHVLFSPGSPCLPSRARRSSYVKPNPERQLSSLSLAKQHKFWKHHRQGYWPVRLWCSRLSNWTWQEIELCKIENTKCKRPHKHLQLAWISCPRRNLQICRCRLKTGNPSWASCKVAPARESKCFQKTGKVLTW